MTMYSTKKEIVYSDIKNKILSGVLKPGHRLNIRSIALEYGMSEIPVREAIQSLEHHQFARVVPHYGAVVAPLSLKEIKEILELRNNLESFATFLATPEMTNNDIEELENNMMEQQLLSSTENMDGFGLLNDAFHEIIYRCNPNSRLYAMINNLKENRMRYHSFFSKNIERTKDSIKDHQCILQAIKERDAEKAQLSMKKHKERTAMQIILNWTDDEETN